VLGTFDSATSNAASALHHPCNQHRADPAATAVEVSLIPYTEWANRGVTAMRTRFPVAEGGRLAT